MHRAVLASLRLPTAFALASLAALPARAGNAPATPAAEVGKPAPGFTLPDLDGRSVSLADLEGRTVVLEWFNPECPFVRYAHTKGPLKELRNRLNGNDVVWLAINSGAPGKQGTGKDKNRGYVKEYGITYPVLLDETGAVGRSYGARTTPHMFVIDPGGVLVYRGALDNAPLGEVEGATATNYVAQALAALAAAKPVDPSDTRSYGCAVKY